MFYLPFKLFTNRIFRINKLSLKCAIHHCRLPASVWKGLLSSENKIKSVALSGLPLLLVISALLNTLSVKYITFAHYVELIYYLKKRPKGHYIIIWALEDWSAVTMMTVVILKQFILILVQKIKTSLGDFKIRHFKLKCQRIRKLYSESYSYVCLKSMWQNLGHNWVYFCYEVFYNRGNMYCWQFW